MERLVEILARALVDKPDEVNVRVVEGEDGMVIELHVAPEDMGKVIGKQGRIAKAIRTLVKASATRQRKRVTVEII